MKLVQKARVIIQGIHLDISWPKEADDYDCDNKTIVVTIISNDKVDEEELKDILTPLTTGGVEKITKINEDEIHITLTSIQGK